MTEEKLKMIEPIYDSFENVDMMLDKIDFLMKSSIEKEGENNAR